MAAPITSGVVASPAPDDQAPATGSLPPWALQKPTFGRTADLVVRVSLALFATPVFVAMSIAMRQLHVLLLLVVMLVIVTFLGTGGHVLDRFPLLGRVKLLGGALRVSHDLDVFYREHRPRGFLVYSFYPLYALIGVFASRIARRELKLHAKLVGVVLVMLLVESAAGYGSSYPPYLGIREAALLVLAQIWVMLFASTLYLMPMMTTVYSLALAGRKKTLRGLLAGSFLLSIPAGYAGWVGTSDIVPFVEQSRLKARLHKHAFQTDLYDLTEMFLDHAAEHDLIGADDARPHVHHKATERYRHMVRGLVLGAEHRAFDVITFRDRDRSKGGDKDAGGVWSGVRVVLGNKVYVLLLRSPTGDMFRSLAHLPETVRKRFVVGKLRQRSGPAETVTKQGLLFDVAPADE